MSVLLSPVSFLKASLLKYKECAFSPWIISTGFLISSAKVRSGVLMKDSAEVLFHVRVDGSRMETSRCFVILRYFKSTKNL